MPETSVAIVSLGACALTEPDSGFPVGGSELQLFLLARKLAETEGFSPTLYVADLGQSEREEAGLRIRPLVRMGRDLRLTFTKALAVICRLARERHQIYVTRSASGINGLVLMAARLTGGKYLHMCANDGECAGNPDAAILSKPARWFHEQAMRRADAVTCQSETQRTALCNHYGREGNLVPSLNPPPAAPTDEPRKGILWVGRDEDCKQPELFVELARRLPEHPFTMACQPQPGRDLHRLIADVPANLRIIPGLPFDETNRLFASHKVLVCTSRREGFPNTFLQAACAGTPVVSLSVDPDDAVTRHKAGVVCGGSFDELVQRARGILDNPSAWETYHEGARRWARRVAREGPRTLDAIRSLKGGAGPDPIVAARDAAWRRGPWRWISTAMVAAIVVGLILYAGPARLWQALVSANLLMILPAVAVIFGQVMLDTSRLALLMRPHGYRSGWGAVLRTNLVVNFVSALPFMPGTIGGGAVAWYRLSRPDGLRAQAFTALSLNAALKLIVVCGVGAAALALDARGSGEYRALIPVLAIGAAVPLMLFFLMIFRGGLNARVQTFHNKALSRALPKRLHDAVRKVLESLDAYRAHRRTAVAALAIGIGRRLFDTLSPLFCLVAVGVEIDFVRLLWIMCAVEAVSMVPLPLFGRGLPEVSFVALLGAVGVGADRSVAAQVISQIALLPMYLTGGGILLSESLSVGTPKPSGERVSEDAGDG